MTRKELRYSFNKVIDAAESLRCENLHHEKKHYHESGFLCPVEYEIQKHCNILREYMKDNLT